MKHLKSFSLIEIMVVVTILGILAASVAPLYKNYIISARAATIVPVVDNLMAQSIQYAQDFGWFGNPGALGMCAACSSTYQRSEYVDNPGSLNPYFGGTVPYQINSLGFGDSSVVPNQPGVVCGQRGKITGQLDPVGLGFSPDIVDSYQHIGFECDYWHDNVMINKACFYWYGTASVSQTGDLIPGWTNANSTSSWDFSNYNTFFATNAGYLNATCQ